MSARLAFRRIAFSLGLLFVLLATAELLLWSTGKVDDPRAFRFLRVTRGVAEDTEGRYRLHEERFYELATGFRHSAGHLGRDAVGAWGFRGRPLEPAPPELLRVAFVGDSCIYGASLDARDMLASVVQHGLAQRGLTPDRVAVASLGVPGYSTVQLRLLLDETLARWRPDAVVLYPAAWNDQAPALLRPDEELLAAQREPSLLDWLRSHTRVVAAALHVRDRVPLDTIMAGWMAQQPPLGWRVPAEQVAANLSAMLARCADAEVPVVVVAPAHPPRTVADHPRTRSDAETVLAVARQAGVPAIDAQEVLRASGAELPRCFVDYVHPSPDGIALLAPPIVAALEAILAPRLRPPPGHALAILEWEPRAASVLGDAPLQVTLDGWSQADALPAVIVGGAPLAELRAIGPHTLQGLLIANARGAADLVVQTPTACAWQPAAIVLEDPVLEPLAPPRTGIRVRGRPRDSLSLHVATSRRDVPLWSQRGAWWLGEDSRELPADLVLDEHGRAELELQQVPAGAFHVQALLSPHDASGAARRWTHPVALRLDG